MTASRARRVPATAAFILLLLAGAPLQAQTQVQGPIQPQEPAASPQPQPVPAPLGPPTPLVPFDPTPRQATGAAPSTPTPTIEGIEVDRLSEIDADAMGIFDAAQSGLGEAPWRNSGRGRVEALLVQLPAGIGSIVLRDLARRLLLVSAPPPWDAAATSGSFISLRVDRLAALGAIDDLARLLEKIPRHAEDERIARARVQTLVLRADLDGACREVRNGIALHHAVAYWPKALIVCQLLAGENEPAALGLALLRERGLSSADGFDDLVAALSGQATEVPAETAAQPLAFAALQARGLALPADLVEQAEPGVLVAMAISGRTPLAQRAAAAERATAVGLLAPDILAQVYSGFGFGLDALGETAAPSDELETPAQRALLYQRVGRRSEPKFVAEAIEGALDAARAEGLYLAMLQVLLPYFSTIPVEPPHVWFAETAGRALYAAGTYERAGAWSALAGRQAATDPLAALAANRLWPYMRLAGGPPSSGPSGVAAWRTANGDTDEATLARWEALLQAAFQALGEAGSLPLGRLAAEQPGDGGATEETGLLLDLKEASETARVGETVLLTLLVLGDGPLAGAEPAALNGAISALRRIGLPLEARALAIEAAAASGI